MRTPRKSVPTSQTPKIDHKLAHNSEQVLAKIKGNRSSMPNTGRASASERQIEIGEKTLPDIATHREMLQKTPINGNSNNKLVLTDIRDRTNNTTMANPYVSQKLRNSAMRIGSGGIMNSPVGGNITANTYGALLPKRESSETRKRRKKSKRSRQHGLVSSKEGGQVSFDLNTMIVKQPQLGVHQQHSTTFKKKAKKKQKQI